MAAVNVELDLDVTFDALQEISINEEFEQLESSPCPSPPSSPLPSSAASSPSSSPQSTPPTSPESSPRMTASDAKDSLESLLFSVSDSFIPDIYLPEPHLQSHVTFPPSPRSFFPEMKEEVPSHSNTPIPRQYARKSDHTKTFAKHFQRLLTDNPQATGLWRRFRREYKPKCSIKRCIRLRLAFCENYGNEFTSLYKTKCFRGLGTRSNCRCTLSPRLSPSLIAETHCCPVSHTLRS